MSGILDYGFSQNMLTTFLQCRRKAKNQLQGWQNIYRPAALDFGTIGHKVEQVVYSAFASKQIKRLDEEDFIKSVVVTESAKHAKKSSTRWTPEDFEEHEDREAQLMALIPAYFKFYSKKDAVREILLEQSFRLPFAGTHINGYIDYQKRVAKKWWLMDTKHLSRVDSDAKAMTDVLCSDFQLNFYTLASRLMHGEFPAGCLYNIVRRPGLRLKKGENKVKFIARVTKDIRDRPTFYFMRHEIPITKDIQRRFEVDLTNLIKEWLEWHKGGMVTTVFGMPCQTKYGLCKYVQLCHNGNTHMYTRRIRK